MSPSLEEEYGNIAFVHTDDGKGFTHAGLKGEKMAQRFRLEFIEDECIFSEHTFDVQS